MSKFYSDNLQTLYTPLATLSIVFFTRYWQSQTINIQLCQVNMYYFSTAEVIKAGITRQTFYTWKKGGEIPFIRIWKRSSRNIIYESEFGLSELRVLFRKVKRKNSVKRGRRMKQTAIT